MSKVIKVITETVKDAKEGCLEFGEVVVDLFTDDEVLAGIPIVSTAVNLLNIKDSYHTNRMARNYISFVIAINTLKQEEIENFLETLNKKEENELEEMMETIFDIIVDSHKPIKAELLGNLLKSLARNEITEKEYNSLALTIYSASVSALYALPDFLKKNHYIVYKSSSSAVENEGLLFSLGVGTRHGNMFRLDDRGINLAKYGFELSVREV